MFTLLKFAFRNIFRFKRRTFITFFAVSFGLALLIIIISLLNGIDKQSISNIINCQTSHIKVFKKGYFDKRDDFPMNLTIKNPHQYHKAIKEIPGVKAVENRILFAASLIKGMDELPCLGVAIEPLRDPDLFNIKQSLQKGEWLEPDDNNILVGNDLAKDMDLEVGDLITIRMVSASDDEKYSWNALDLEIKGIFESGNPTVDSNRIILPMKVAQEGLSMESEVTEIVVRLTSDEDKLIAKVQGRLTASLDPDKQILETYSWKDLASTFLAISKIKTKYSGFIVFIMLFVASIGIINTMLMTVLERTREIGMLGAMGMKKSDIMKLFIFEGGFIGIFGAIFGCLFGGLASWYLEVKGWSMASLGEMMADMSKAAYPIKDVFYADLTVGVLLMTFIFGVFIATLASVYPARRAANQNPIQALRHI